MVGHVDHRCTSASGSRPRPGCRRGVRPCVGQRFGSPVQRAVQPGRSPDVPDVQSQAGLARHAASLTALSPTSVMSVAGVLSDGASGPAAGSSPCGHRRPPTPPATSRSPARPAVPRAPVLYSRRSTDCRERVAPLMGGVGDELPVPWSAGWRAARASSTLSPFGFNACPTRPRTSGSRPWSNPALHATRRVSAAGRPAARQPHPVERLRLRATTALRRPRPPHGPAPDRSNTISRSEATQSVRGTRSPLWPRVGGSPPHPVRPISRPADRTCPTVDVGPNGADQPGGVTPVGIRILPRRSSAGRSGELPSVRNSAARVRSAPFNADAAVRRPPPPYRRPRRGLLLQRRGRLELPVTGPSISCRVASG